VGTQSREKNTESVHICLSVVLIIQRLRSPALTSINSNTQISLFEASQLKYMLFMTPDRLNNRWMMAGVTVWGVIVQTEQTYIRVSELELLTL